MWAHVENNAITEVKGVRPQWTLDDGSPVSDATLLEHGWYPVETQTYPSYDDLLHYATDNPMSEWTIDADKVLRTKTITDRSILEIKDDAAQRIDASAESTRGMFLTPGSGQALEYKETAEEIARWHTAADPDIDDYPMLRAEWRARQVDDPDVTVDTIISDTMNEVSLWKIVGSAIKEIRRTAKVAVDVAETGTRVRQIVDWSQAAYASAATTGTFDPLP